MKQKESLILTPTVTRKVVSAHGQGDTRVHGKSSSPFKKACLVLKIWSLEIYWIICRFAKAFEYFTAFIVILNVGILTADTFDIVSVYAGWFVSALDSVFLGIFLMEFMLKFIVSGHLYFKSLWNVLDFILLLIDLVEMFMESMEAEGSVTGFSALRIFKGLRAARALRVLRIIRNLQSYQLVLSTCRQSLPSMSSIILLMVLFMLMFCVIFRETFSETDPERFGSIFSTLFTLFQLLTVDDWFLIYTTSRARGAAGIIIYLIPYIFLMNYILLNLVISVFVDNFKIAIKNRKAERQRIEETEEFLDVDEDEVQSQMKIDLDTSAPETNEKVHQETLQSSSLRYSKRKAELMARSLQILAAIEESQQTLRSQSALMNKLFVKAFEVAQISQYYQSEGTKANLTRAEIVIIKCIQTFHLHEQFHEESRGLPKYTIKDLVAFDISAQRRTGITMEDHRLARLKTRHSKYPPLDIFAHWILESKFFSNMVMLLIFLNSIIQLIQAVFLPYPNKYDDMQYMVHCFIYLEIFDKMEPHFQILAIVLDILESGILGIFFLEILLKWLDNFWQFWKSSWNIFDFCVTILVSAMKLCSFIPEILKATSNSQMVHLSFLKYFRKLRVLRCLKVVSKYRPVRVVVLAISRSFKAVANIYLLLFVFMFIFALAGMNIFQNYNRSSAEGLVFSESFSDLSAAFITLFMIFTLDNWHALLSEVQKVPELDSITCSLYIIFWIFIGSFIFRNIFIGIMTNTFNSVRSELSKVVEQIEMQHKTDLFKAEIIKRRLSQPKIPVLAIIPEEHEESLSTKESSLSMTSSAHNKKEKLDWETYVEENMQAMWLQKEDEKVMWPKDLLLRYYVLMKTLQDILDTRMELQNLLVQLLLNMQDSFSSKEPSPSFSS
ncbi:cation channel sperm-associated protein 2-like [Electrophorus electricus]|uniref:cation channel sperm-associated protein 2-like n=1 Tax=Electrophorus electricus TaxID=8005 RepID=UPI0015D0A52C|nr:cation channel sperm-associated protein 2-like [Electrophorus electricus]